MSSEVRRCLVWLGSTSCCASQLQKRYFSVSTYAMLLLRLATAAERKRQQGNGSGSGSGSQPQWTRYKFDLGAELEEDRVAPPAANFGAYECTTASAALLYRASTSLVPFLVAALHLSTRCCLSCSSCFMDKW